MSTLQQEFPRRHPISVHDYHRMAAAGILHEDSRVELIEGEIIDMTPIGTVHASTVAYLCKKLQLAVGNRAVVWPQNPLRLSEYSEPQPDITLLRPRDDFYRDAHPQAADVLLLIEVADTSIWSDRERKIPFYARHGIPEVWLVDVGNKSLESFRDPREGTYRDIRRIAAMDCVEALQLPGVQIDLSELF